MQTEQPTKCFEPLQKLGRGWLRKTCSSPEWCVAGRSRALVLLWFSVACFWCQSLGDVSHLMCVHIILSSVSVAEWASFGK